MGVTFGPGQRVQVVSPSLTGFVTIVRVEKGLYVVIDGDGSWWDVSESMLSLPEHEEPTFDA